MKLFVTGATDSGRTGIVLRFGQFYGPDAMQTRGTIAFVRKGWAPMPGAADAFISSVAHDDAASAVVAAIDAHEGATTWSTPSRSRIARTSLHSTSRRPGCRRPG